MARRYEIMYEENLPIPPDAYTLEGFWRWLESDEFPESGRIDFLDGEILADMSPESMYTHGAVKVEVITTLAELILRTGRGDVQTDSCRFRSQFAGVSTEPDVMAVLNESVESGRVRFVPSTRHPEQFLAYEGPVDLIVEIVSNSSVGKDLKQLPPLYARAGVRELWLLDTRKDRIRFDLLTLNGDRYVPVSPDPEGWLRSPRLKHSFRLVRFQQPPFPERYRLEHRED
jgi:Uma2 family endonuclease